MASRTYKAFVSSTFVDLKEHRKHVIDALRNAKIHVDPMENWTADGDEPKAFSQKRVEGCDLCVLLVALRRGFVAPGETLSITQMEYERARALKIEVHVYLFDDSGDYLWPRRFDELQSDAEIGKWRQELKLRHGCTLFDHHPEPLGEKVLAAVSRWLQEKQRSQIIASPSQSGRFTRTTLAAVPRIFVSYRREDSLHQTGRIDDRLAFHFGRDNVFLDIDTIPLGVDFREYLDQAVGCCDFLLAVIGEQWLDARHLNGPKQGQRRLDDPADFVRIEILSALARGVPVIPVLVGNARMPVEQQLPSELKILAYHNAAEVRSGRDFHDHVDHLIRGIEGLAHRQG